MKICILTLPPFVNYGGILQAFALQTVLEGLGNDVKIISPSKLINKPILKGIIKMPYRILKRLYGSNVDLMPEYKYNKQVRTIQKNVELTIKEYLKLDNRVIETIRNNDYDGYVVGSDQIWRPLYIKDVLGTTIPNAYLGFARAWDVKKIAYAVSFGTDEWEYSPNETDTIRELVKEFHAISVREKSAVELLADHLNAEAVHVLDPTFLLSKEDYVQTFRIASEPTSAGTLFNYILDLDEEKESLIDKVANDRHLKPFRVGAKIDDRKAPLSERIQPRLQKWIRGFYDAEFVITDSFHACVFSIIFNKPFIAIGNEKRGMARFESLLSSMGLMKNLITSSTQYNPKNDYSIPSYTYEKLDEWRASSYNFLKDNLS